MGCLAFDTSNYTTSVAYYDGVQAVSCAKLLDVAPGQWDFGSRTRCLPM